MSILSHLLWERCLGESVKKIVLVESDFLELHLELKNGQRNNFRKAFLLVDCVLAFILIVLHLSFVTL